MSSTTSHSRSQWDTTSYLLFAVIMCLMGGLYWGVRGAGGYGGESGAMLAGAGWATWWYLASYCGEGADRRPYGGVWVIPAITFGVAFGGFTGYGVYISWLSGNYHYNFPDTPRPIAPIWGYTMLFLCGLHWGGIAGVFLSWCAPVRPVTWWMWGVRIGCGIAGLLAARWWLGAYPQVYLPFYDEGIYEHKEWATVQRTVHQIEPIAEHLGLLAGFLAFEVGRRDWRAVGIILLMAIGFAIPFCVGGIWQTNYDSEWKLGWWKHWEMTIGLGGGLAFGLAFWIFNRPGDAKRALPDLKRPYGAVRDFATSFFTCDLPIWLVLVNNVYGACKGRLKMHEVDLPNSAIIVIILAGVGMCTWTMFMRWRGDRLVDFTPDGNRLPLRPFVLIQGSILAGMLLVSIPREMSLGNAVILSAYAVYITVSAICAWRLYERVGEVETIPYVTPGQRFRM